MYKNIKNVEIHTGKTQIKIDSETGEIYFDDPTFYKFYKKGDFEAISERIGNISEVSFLREEVINLLGTESYLLKYVLFEGTASGVVIKESDLGLIEPELLKLKSYSLSQEMRQLIAKMTKLIAEARIQKNPIVMT